MAKKILYCLLLFAVAFAIVQSCTTHRFRTMYHEANTVVHETENLYYKPFLKAHHKNGDISILLKEWQIDTVANTVTGSGSQYDFNRKKIYEGEIMLDIDSIVLFETNTRLKAEEGRIAALVVMGVANIGLAAYCILNPKACFGSCPTFYVNSDENLHYSDAEGFSNAILPSLEYADIDAIGNYEISEGEFAITMKNEALETHCIKNVKLLAYPTGMGERVYQSPADEFYLSRQTYPLQNASASEGNITSLLLENDKNERFSLADGQNLNSKEEIYLDFKNPEDAENLGLIVHYRQSLMTTYLFYSAMGYMGDLASDMFALLETDEELRNNFDATTKLLGNIDVYVFNEDKKSWIFCGGLSETGPIAINKHILPLKGKSGAGGVKVKLVLNKGLWRIDYVALAKIEQQVQPMEVEVSSVLNSGKEDYASLKKLHKTDEYLVSMPGSNYKLQFNLPGNSNEYELFLYSKGYYLEWMRPEWLKEKNMLKLKQMVYSPGLYLRKEAKNYKVYEGTMEEQFWNSRISEKSFSANEE